MNENLDYNYNNSSTFITYKDYTNSAGINFAYFQVIPNSFLEKQPTFLTQKAIDEALDNKNLKAFSTVDDFIDDLEK